jgi:ABC-type bacteriocin/lantibiotic exporter with double-glycine peptidase domain
VTSDIGNIQGLIASSVLGALINCLTLVGMVTVMFYINWRFTLIALSGGADSFRGLFIHAPHQEGNQSG